MMTDGEPSCCSHADTYHYGVHSEYPACQCWSLPSPTEPHAYLPSNAHSTSIEAATAVLPRSGTQRARVLECLREAWPGGLTDDELVQRHGTGVKAGVRRQELVEKGWVEEEGTMRLTRNNCRAKVWCLTGMAVVSLDNEREE